jgi:hypothetical protein
VSLCVFRAPLQIHHYAFAFSASFIDLPSSDDRRWWIADHDGAMNERSWHHHQPSLSLNWNLWNTGYVE